MMQCTLAIIKHELFDDKGYSDDNIGIRPSLKRGTGFKAWKFETKLINSRDCMCFCRRH